MQENRIKRNKMLGEHIIKNLNGRHMEGYYTESKEEALKKALELIPTGSSVGWGGSMSAEAIGLIDAVKTGDYRAIDRKSGKDAEDKRRLQLEVLGSDYFICSSNAITEDGELVNIDGMGNRVAAIVYGPRNVIMIVGMNKVVATLDDAMSRARNIAAPLNANRFNIDTPCTKTGVCHDCLSIQSVCSQFLITRCVQQKGRIKVILVDEDLGL
ncbi:MAG: lactate utilization protein [Suipraeoptans sp.]